MQGTGQQGRAHSQPRAGGEARHCRTRLTRGTGSALSCVPSPVSLQKMLSILRQPPPCSPLRQNVSTDRRSGVNMSELTQRSVPALQSVSGTNLVPWDRQPSGIPGWKGSTGIIGLKSSIPPTSGRPAPPARDPPGPAASNHLTSLPFLSIPSARSCLFHSLCAVPPQAGGKPSACTPHAAPQPPAVLPRAPPKTGGAAPGWMDPCCTAASSRAGRRGRPRYWGGAFGPPWGAAGSESGPKVEGGAWRGKAGAPGPAQARAVGGAALGLLATRPLLPGADARRRVTHFRPVGGTCPWRAAGAGAMAEAQNGSAGPQAVPAASARPPATPEGIALAYGSLVLMALLPIFFGALRSVSCAKSKVPPGLPPPGTRPPHSLPPRAGFAGPRSSPGARLSPPRLAGEPPAAHRRPARPRVGPGLRPWGSCPAPGARSSAAEPPPPGERAQAALSCCFEPPFLPLCVRLMVSAVLTVRAVKLPAGGRQQGMAVVPWGFLVLHTAGSGVSLGSSCALATLLFFCSRFARRLLPTLLWAATDRGVCCPRFQP